MNEYEKDIIRESIDFDLDLYQIIFDIHFESPTLSISEKYSIAISAIQNLDELGFIEVHEKIYKKSGKKHIVDSSRIISNNELDEVLKHPTVWDRAHLSSFSDAIVVLATDKGIEAIDEIER